MPSKRRRCTRCGKQKPLKAFYVGYWSNPERRAAECKRCLRARGRAYYRTHAAEAHARYVARREEISAYNKAYYQTHRDEIREQRAKRKAKRQRPPPRSPDRTHS